VEWVRDAGSWAHPRPKQAPTEIRAWFGKQVKLSQ
jgi:hypothetical protein